MYQGLNFPICKMTIKVVPRGLSEICKVLSVKVQVIVINVHFLRDIVRCLWKH